MANTGIRFAEKQNAEDLVIEPNLQAFGTIYVCSGSGGSGNGIRYFAVNPAALLTSGPFTRQSNFPDIAAFTALQKAGTAQVTSAAIGASAMTLTVNDDGTDGLWGPGDTIVVHFPSLGVVELTCTVLGVDVEENSSVKTVHLNQHALGNVVAQLALIRSQLNDAVAGGSRAEITDISGLTAIDLSAQQAIVIRDANGKVRLRAGRQTDGKYGVRAYDASGNLINTSTSTAFDYTA